MIHRLLIVLALILSISIALETNWAYGVDLKPGQSEVVNCVQPTPAPTQAPTPTAQPTPVPTSAPNFVTTSALQAAINAARPGDVIRVTGTWTPSTSITSLALLVNKPVHIIGQNAVINLPVVPNGQVRITADAIIEGFEIKGGWTGIKIYSKATVRKNKVHYGKYGNIMVTTDTKAIDGLVIEDNVLDRPGYDPTKIDTLYSDISPKHIQNLYIGDYSCKGQSNITVRSNTMTRTPGRAIQWNGSQGGDGPACSTKFTNFLVEDNYFQGSWGMVGFFNLLNSTVRNNTLEIKIPPRTNDNDHPCIGLYGSIGNVFSNNKCTSPDPGNLGGGIARNYSGSSNNTFLNNQFILGGN